MIKTPTVSHIVVSACAGHAALTQELRKVFGACNDIDIDLQVVNGLPGHKGKVDLRIQVVDEACLEASLQELASWRACDPCCAVLIISDGLSASDCARLLAAGASDFLRAPFADDELVLRSLRALGRPVHSAPAVPRNTHQALRNLIGDSPAFDLQASRLSVFAKYDASVLIVGETGTGKKTCGLAMHELSARAENPWVVMKCNAGAADMIEAELFGYVDHADVEHSHSSLVGQAEGGTLYLDGVESLPIDMQAKLLHFLQNKEYRPVGSKRVLVGNVRVIAASHQNLTKLVARGTFCQNLLFQLNVLKLHLPPLRDRGDDITKLANFFLRAAAHQWQCPVPSINPAAIQKLHAYHWPGNVRELKNVMERAALASTQGQLQEQDIDIDVASAETASTGIIMLPSTEPFRTAKARVVETFERAYIQQLLTSNQGNVTRAAHAAKKNRRAFFELMRKHQIEPSPFRPNHARSRA